MGNDTVRRRTKIFLCGGCWRFVSLYLKEEERRTHQPYPYLRHLLATKLGARSLSTERR
jgi:hypothetical protein